MIQKNTSTYPILGIISIILGLSIVSLSFLWAPFAHASTTSSPEAIYIWSSAQKTYGADYITQYLVKNKITTAIISLTDSSKSVFKKLLTSLPKKGKHIEALFGDNHLLTEENPEAYFDTLFDEVNTSKISAMHLDIEPRAHSAFPDYYDRPEYYDDLYIELLRATKEYAHNHGMELSVDIPVSYGPDMLEKIYEQADHVYVMAYEIQSMNYLKSKVQDEMNQDKSETVIAFRVDDFENQKELTSYFKNASQKLNTTHFALHDFGRIVKLPKK